ncbi:MULTISPECIES: hypothetical protein [Streptomyces]|uniref:hypothetical protein n=1 Tax=Streptomyces TaxID=1883 RepID=UPI0004AB57E7|nr:MULTISPECIES: hypothetical protein [Streptomyces]
MSDEPLDLDEDDDEDDPWIVATCPIGPELAAQIAGMADLDWTDGDAGEEAMTAAGWSSTGDYLGELNGKACTPAGHFVYGDDCLFVPFIYEYYVNPDGPMGEDFWGTLPGWQGFVDPPVGTFDAQLDAVADQFAALLGPPDHDISRERRPRSGSIWRYRIWRRGGNALVVAPGMDPFSYSQFEHAFVQIRPLPADAPLPAPSELVDFFNW